jgi:hypothetical protein
MECHGVPEFVIVSGRVCVDEGDLKAVQGFGNFIPTPVFPPYVYSMVKEREEVKHTDKNCNFGYIWVHPYLVCFAFLNFFYSNLHF